MKSGFVKFLETSALIFGCGGILLGFISPGIDIGTRILYIVLGLMIGSMALFAAFRWIFVSLLFLAVGITGIFNIATGVYPLDISWCATVLVCFAISAFYGYKAFKKFRKNNSPMADLYAVDVMTGLEFEEFTAELLQKLGYYDVQVTKASGDQGIDVLATKSGTRYAIQCKNYASKLDNTPVQEAYAGKAYYGYDVGVVITNSTFTDGAYQLANSIGVLLWDRHTLQAMIEEANAKNRKPEATRKKAAPQPDTPTIPPAQKDIPQPVTQPAYSPQYTHISPSTSTAVLIDCLQEGVADPLFPAAVDLFLETGQASVSMIQRRLKVGYAQAARIVDEMEEKGIVGPFRGSTPREILISRSQWDIVRPCITVISDQGNDAAAGRTKRNSQDSVNAQFIAEAQWYAARGGSDLVDDN